MTPLQACLPSVFPLDVVDLTPQYDLVGIDQVGDFHVVLFEPAIDMATAATVDTGDGDTQPVVGAQHLCAGASAANGEGRSEGK